LASVVIVLVLAAGGLHHPLAVSVPLMLLGIGHGLLVPPTLAGAVGTIPALAGAAAALAGMLQQSFGAAASYVTGFVDQTNALGMGALMVIFGVLASISQFYLLRRLNAASRAVNPR
jgi:DHA1 family bicyclomycin/chloramphenicol resistance-like MFS transporter